VIGSRHHDPVRFICRATEHSVERGIGHRNEFKRGITMSLKKLALIAFAAVVCTAAPAAAQIDVRMGDGYRHHQHRGDGYRRSRNEVVVVHRNRHHGWDRPHRRPHRTVIISR
jgi:hypothetical protein